MAARRWLCLEPRTPTPDETRLKLMGSVASHASHLSLTTRTKYCGGSGESETGTVKVSRCSLSAWEPRSTKYWWWSSASPSASSTSTHHPSAPAVLFFSVAGAETPPPPALGTIIPRAAASQVKSGVSVRSTFSTERVMGCTDADSSSLGNACTSRWSARPALGARTSSPSSAGVRSW